MKKAIILVAMFSTLTAQASVKCDEKVLQKLSEITNPTEAQLNSVRTLGTQLLAKNEALMELSAKLEVQHSKVKKESESQQKPNFDKGVEGLGLLANTTGKLMAYSETGIEIQTLITANDKCLNRIAAILKTAK